MTPKGLTVCVRINAFEAAALDRAARERGVSRQAVVKQLIASMSETKTPNRCSPPSGAFNSFGDSLSPYSLGGR